MSPGTLYHHFPSKEALIEAIILEDQERALTHFREPLEGVGLVDYLVESTIAVTREDCAQRALVVEIMAEGMRNPQVAEMLTNKYHTLSPRWLHVLTMRRRRGKLAPMWIKKWRQGYY